MYVLLPSFSVGLVYKQQCNIPSVGCIIPFRNYYKQRTVTQVFRAVIFLLMPNAKTNILISVGVYSTLINLNVKPWKPEYKMEGGNTMDILNNDFTAN